MLAVGRESAKNRGRRGPGPCLSLSWPVLRSPARFEAGRPRPPIELSTEVTTLRPGNPETLAQPYDPTLVESRWYAFWEKHGVFQPRSQSGTGEPYVISIPPHNVTGSLDMGHLHGESIRDILLRWR